MTDRIEPRDLNSKLSRREFLRYCSLGTTGLLLPKQFMDGFVGGYSPPIDQRSVLGRVTRDGFPLFTKPDFQSAKIKEMELDSLWQITGLRMTTEVSSRNRIWYELDRKGFAHSSRIQPVRQQINPVGTVIPEDGCLGEITVPFVEAYQDIDDRLRPVYRMYYASTFWIVDRQTDRDSGVWYKILDDLYYTFYYVPAEAIRLVPESELTALSPGVPAEDKKLVIDLTAQRLTAYEGERVVYMTRLSSGIRMEEGGFATPIGHYRTTHKRPCRHMFTPPSEFGTGFDLPGVPWVCYFTRDGVALHGTYWHNDFGVPYSHGCINLRPSDAKWVYRWTDPNVPSNRYYYSEVHGTRVVIQ